MFETIKNYATLQTYLIRNLEASTTMLVLFDKARAGNDLVSFMRYSSVEMHKVIVFAKQSQIYLDYMDREVDTPANEVYDDLLKDVIRKVKRHDSHGRSVSHSANFTDDFIRDFYLEIFSRIED